MVLSELFSKRDDCLGREALLEEAIHRMGQSGLNHVVFVEENKPAGILTLKDIIKLYSEGIDAKAAAIDHATFPVVMIHDDRPLDMAVEMMVDYGIRRIVVVDEEGLYRGTLTQGDVLNFYEVKFSAEHEVFECIGNRNRALMVDSMLSVSEAVRKMQEGNRDVLIVAKDDKAIGIITEKDILHMAYRKISLDEPLSRYMHTPVISVEMHEKINHAVEKMKESNIRHLLVEGGEGSYFVLGESDLVLNYNTALELKLEARLRDAKATYNLLGIAFCEIIDLGETQIIKWLNAEAMLTFGVKIDDSVEKMLGCETWQQLMQTLRKRGGVDRERIEIKGRTYEVSLLDTEVNEQPILKLFINDVSELVRMGEELQRSLEKTIELEQEKSKLFLEIVSVIFMALDAEGNVLMINPKGCDVLGYSKEEIVGKNWFDTFVCAEDAEISRALLEDIMIGRRELVEYYDNTVCNREGNERIITWHNALMKDALGNVVGILSSGEDITKMQESQEEINRLVHYDLLTELPNRLLLRARLEHSMQRAKREKRKVAVLYLDIDSFKDINESYGYGVGDFVIKRLASKMRTHIRHEDTLSRVGGDEFVLLLEEIHEAGECERSLKELISVFNEPIETQAGELRLTASIGIALYPDDGEEGETLLKHADIALRKAKETGQNNYCFFTPDMSAQLFERILMERELHRAIEANEFVVYYQPQIDLQSGKLVGAEALVRWEHPTFGTVYPDMFISLAEEKSLIIPIGEAVLAQSCERVKRWIEDGLFTGKISVNVSGKQFERPDVVERIAQIITGSGIDPRAVELEITESVLMGNPVEFGEKLIALKALGIEVAIDDFGTGYSSLSYLKAFPIDKLKIDQSFVRGIPKDDQDCAIVRAVIAMADALGLKTIAEGIEVEEQHLYLKNLGCMQGQGYLYARPLNPEKFEEFLKAKV